MTGKDVCKEGQEQDENHTATRQGNLLQLGDRGMQSVDGRSSVSPCSAINELIDGSKNGELFTLQRAYL